MQDEILVTGMVLSQMPVSEADRRIVLLTKELGRITCFARGARKPTSRLLGVTRPFSFGTFTLYPGKDAYTLSRAEIQYYFEEMGTDMEASFYGCYFLELSGYFTRENTDATKELALLFYAIRALLNKNLQKELVRRVFELRLLYITGLVPDFSVCPRCQKPFQTGFFKTSLMQVVCSDCETDGAYPLSKSALYAIRYTISTELRKLFSFALTEEALKEMGDTVEVLYQRNVERSLKSREILFSMVDVSL